MADTDYPPIEQAEIERLAGDVDRSSIDARVMFDARYIHTKVTGIGRYSYNILRQLLRLDDTLRLTVLTHPSRPNLVRSPRAECRTVPIDPFSPLTRFAVGSMLDFTGIDLYHSTFNLQPARIPIPTVLTLHDVMWLIDADYVASNWLERLVSAPFFKWCTNHSVREADRVLTVSDHSRDEIEERFPEKRGRVDVTYNAADEYFQPVEPSEGWPLLGEFLPPRSTFVLAVGAQSPYKNHVGALEGFIEAFADDPLVYFVLVQRRTYRSKGRLGELLEHPKVGPRILRLEYVTDAQLRALYSLARTFLFPSLYEGFGLPILESMACGTPVVTSNRGAPAEVAGDAAATVDPKSPGEIAEALRRLYEDDAYYERLRRAGFERARAFDWKRCGRATLECYRKVVG